MAIIALKRVVFGVSGVYKKKQQSVINPISKSKN
jgi:hypothetical protein